MSIGFVAVAGATLVGSKMASDAQKDAARRGAAVQSEATELGIEEQRRQFDALVELIQPYTEGGELAFEAQQALIGLAGEDAQQEAIAQIEQSPEFQMLTQQGEDALLQNASATGGLRGGNLQKTLAEFRPQLLSNLIQKQFANLGGISQMGQNAATFQGTSGQNSANAITGLIQQGGAAEAGKHLAIGEAKAGIGNTIGQLAGLYAFTGGKF